MWEVWNSLSLFEQVGFFSGLTTIITTFWGFSKKYVYTQHISRKEFEKTKDFIEKLQESASPPKTSVKRKIVDFDPKRANKDGTWENYVFKLNSRVSEPYGDLFVYEPQNYSRIIQSQVETYCDLFHLFRYMALVVFLASVYFAFSTQQNSSILSFILPVISITALPSMAVVGLYLACRSKRNDLRIASAYLKAMQDRGIMVEYVFSQRNST